MKQPHVHIVGIKGMGTSSLAVIYLQKGYKVTGSDEAASSVADHLLRKYPQITVFSTFKEEHINDTDLIIRSVAYGQNNPEVKAAQEQGKELLTYPEAVGKLLKGYSTIAVAGCNGKTTTSGMIATMMVAANLDPSYIVGGGLQSGMDNAKIGQSPYFIIEADEYRDAFQNYAATANYVVLTNIDHDHPDYYPSMTDVVHSFERFINATPPAAQILICGDDKGNQLLIPRINKPFETYGLKDTNDWQIKDLSQGESGSTFVLSNNKRVFGSFILSLPGMHNVFNAAATAVIGIKLNISIEAINSVLTSFKGAKRRFEKLYDSQELTLIDDYAHHPAAIEVNIAGVRQNYPNKKVIAVFQPHTYSRTQLLLNEFAQALSFADEIYLLNIFGSVRENSADFSVSSQDIVMKIKEKGKTARLIENVEEFMAIAENLTDGPSVILVMGAGDVGKTISEPLASRLKKK